MYEKLKNLSIEELEVEIEDLDICITNLYKERNEANEKIKDLMDEVEVLENKIVGLRALSRICSDLILEKQREGAQ